ncbi:MAG: hypothetical protein AAF500_22095 [Myxococcota bacterium]
MWLAVVGFAVATGADAEAESFAARSARLQHWLGEIRASDEADVVAGATGQAARALDVAVDTSVDQSGRVRAQAIAEAALVLADRQVARQEAAKALIATERRVAATKDRAAAQRRVLEALMRERATLALASENSP